MSAEDDFAAYEAMLARALEYAEGMGERGPMRAEPAARWLARWEGGLRLYWLDDGDLGLEERSKAIPWEAFVVPAAEFQAWVSARRDGVDARQAANWDLYQKLVGRIFDKPG